MAITAIGAIPDMATTGMGRPTPATEAIVEGTGTATPAGAITVEIASMAETDSMVEVAITVAVVIMVEAAPTMVGTGRLHPQLEALAADGICRRPLHL
jgi:hypothetical protein